VASSSRILQLFGRSIEKMTFLAEQLTHVLRTCAGGGLIGHGGNPFHEAGLEEATDGHEHQADGAVATNEILLAVGQRLVDDGAVDGVENDSGLIGHAQGRGRIDPVAVPAFGAQLAMHLSSIVPALAGDDRFHLHQRVEIVGVDQDRFALADVRCRLARLRCGEKYGVDMFKIVFRAHALHQHRADHAAPSN